MRTNDKLKTAIAFVLLFAVCIVAITLDLKDNGGDVYPNGDTEIMLYGEAHGVEEYYDAEFKLWKGYYDDGCRNLFVELPYYSAEFLNVWMKESSDELLDVWFDEIKGTLSGNEYYYNFLKSIKENCPETVFYGTDIGHQSRTTGARYLKYLEEDGLKESENYTLTEECMRQYKEYYESDETHDGVSDVREEYMISNFKAAYERCGGGWIMGIYGSYHTDLNALEVMAGRLKEYYGEEISSVKISSVIMSSRSPYTLGVCFTGIVFLAMLFVPNIIWANGKKPKGYEQAEKRENKALLAFERIGEVVVTASLLIFRSIDPLIKKFPDGIYFKWDLLIWLAALVLMILYECYWTGYFKSDLTMKDMYSSFAGFPVAGATLPTLAVLLLGVYSRNCIVVASALILGVGHIGIHLEHKREMDESQKNLQNFTKEVK